MSDTQAREQDLSLGGAAVDQGTRANQTPPPDEPASEADIIADLRRQMAEMDAAAIGRDAEITKERARAETAERGRAAAESRAAVAETAKETAERTGQRTVEEGQLELVKSQLQTSETQLDQLSGAKAALIAEGKFDEAAKIDVQMARLGGRIAQLEDGKAALEERIKNPPAEPARREHQSQTEIDQRNNFIARQPPLIQQWLRGSEGERFFTDQAFQQDVAAAARLAMRRHPLDSQEYIDFVREQIGLKTPAAPPPASRNASDQIPPAQPSQRPDGGRMTAAPAGGASPGSVRRNADGSTQVYLTSNEREMADRMGVSHAEYAREKAKLLDEGLIGPRARNS